MTPAELLAHAYAAIAVGGRGMTITLPPGWRRPAGFPRCELLSVNAAGDRNVRVMAHRVIEWLGKQGIK